MDEGLLLVNLGTVFDVQFDFGGGWLSEAIVCQADVDPRVVSRLG